MDEFLEMFKNGVIYKETECVDNKVICGHICTSGPSDNCKNCTMSSSCIQYAEYRNYYYPESNNGVYLDIAV